MREVGEKGREGKEEGEREREREGSKKKVIKI